MVLAAVVLGGLALYYFGVRAAAWAAGATLALSIIAAVLPRYATAIHVFIAAGALALWMIGRKRPRPPDAVLAVRLVRRAIGRAWALLRGRRE
jgi:hypothetical protein